MEADFDLNSNDLLNAATLNAATLAISGNAVIDGTLTVAGTNVNAQVTAAAASAAAALVSQNAAASSATNAATSEAAAAASASAASASNIGVKVVAATTANITISTALNNADTLDGVTLVTDELVLVKNQTASEENGVYIVSATPVRAVSHDVWDDYPGELVTVQEGTTNSDSVWLCTADAGGTLDTTAITWTEVVVTGDDLFLDSGGMIDLSSGDVTFTHSTNTLTIAGGVLATEGLFTCTDFRLTSTTPRMVIVESDSSADNKRWDFVASGETAALRAVNDAGTVASNIISATRTGTTIDSVTIGGTSVTIGGTLASGSIDVGTTNITLGGQLNIDTDGTAIGADGAITFGVGEDGSIYSSGANLIIDVASQLNLAFSGTTDFAFVANFFNVAAGSKVNMSGDGTAINTSGALTFGVGNDGAIYSDGTNLQIDVLAQLEIEVAGTEVGHWDAGGINLVTGDQYEINEAAVLTATTLGGAVVNSSLTNVGTLTTLTVDDITLNANAITSVGASSMTIVPTGGQSLLLDGVLDIDGAVMGYTGVFTTTGSIIVDTMTIDAGSITDSSAAISFGDENLSTTGTLAAGATTVGVLIATSYVGSDDMLAKTSDGAILTLQTSLTEVVSTSVLGRIDFQAPNEAGGTDAIIVAASIFAEADNTFAADNNETDLVFALGASEAAVEVARFTHEGFLGIGTSTPGFLLEVESATTPKIVVTFTDNTSFGQFAFNEGANTLAHFLIPGTVFSAGSRRSNLEVSADSDITLRPANVQAWEINEAGQMTVGPARASPATMAYIDQSSTTGAQPVMILDQADIDDSFINFVGTSAADASRSVSSATTEVDAPAGYVKIEVNGTDRFLRFYADVD